MNASAFGTSVAGGEPVPVRCTAPSGFAVQDAYVRTFHPESNLVLLLRPDGEGEAQDLFTQIAVEEGIDMVDAVVAPFLVLEFRTAQDAALYCSGVPLGNGLALAYSYGEQIGDNSGE